MEVVWIFCWIDFYFWIGLLVVDNLEGGLRVGVVLLIWDDNCEEFIWWILKVWFFWWIILVGFLFRWIIFFYIWFWIGVWKIVKEIKWLLFSSIKWFLKLVLCEVVIIFCNYCLVEFCVIMGYEWIVIISFSRSCG